MSEKNPDECDTRASRTREGRDASSGSRRQPVILIGGGEHARTVAEAVQSQARTFEIRGFVDPSPPAETTSRLGLTCLGDDRALEAHGDAWGVIALGALRPTPRREALAQRCEPYVRGFATIVHSNAWVSPTAWLGPGTVVMAGVVVQSGARIGAHCIVNTGAVIEHDVLIEPFAVVGPRVAIGGGSRVGRGAFLGLGACLRDHITVGEGALVAMGAVVTSSVEAGVTVRGVPAR